MFFGDDSKTPLKNLFKYKIINVKSDVFESVPKNTVLKSLFFQKIHIIMYKFQSLVDTNLGRSLSMKTICIKTNNSIVLDYLLNELRMSNIQSICFYTKKQFKHYNNIIIHYNGQNEDDFIHFVADILSYLIIDELEEDFLSNIIQQNYCYF